MNILITICARGGSKGIPGKNIKFLNGMPLIAYTINTAKRFALKYNATIGLSTDSQSIKDIAAEYGVFTNYVRPDRLATDQSGKIGVIDHLLKFEEGQSGKVFDYVLDLDVTSPLRTVEDLEAALSKLKECDKGLNIFSVSHANRNPYFNMVEEIPNSQFVKVVKAGEAIKARQSAPVVYDMNASFYIFRRKFFQEGYTTSTTERSLAYLMPHECFDLDELIDFKVMKILMRENLLDITL
jgi:CMP-N,N'-diacetyllegionaminic acid synthase